MKIHLGKYSKLYKIGIPLALNVIYGFSIYIEKTVAKGKVEDFPIPLTTLVVIFTTIQLFWEYGKGKIDEYDEDSEINKLKKENERLQKNTALLIKMRENLVNRKINKNEKEIKIEEFTDKILECLNENNDLNCGQKIPENIMNQQGELLKEFLERNKTKEKNLFNRFIS